ncbi:hypothetical protein BGW42_008279 [Actinomortierella wolfii]|nr:hypothetical protein BGW42_008279 [Actinomortierella wolfii]
MARTQSLRSDAESNLSFSALTSLSSPSLNYNQSFVFDRTTSAASAGTSTTRRLISIHSSLSFSSPPVPIQSFDIPQRPARMSFGALGSESMRNPFQVNKDKEETSTSRRISSSGLLASERASRRSDDDREEDDLDMGATSHNLLAETDRGSTPQKQQSPHLQHRLSGNVHEPLHRPSLLPGGQSEGTPSRYGGLSGMMLGGLSTSNSPFRGLSSIGGGGAAGGDDGMDLLTSGERDRSKDLQVEKSRLLEQLRNMRSEVDELEAKLQALRRKKARSNTTSVEQQQRKLAKEAQDMRKFLYKLNSSTVTPITKSLNEEDRDGKRDRTSLLSNGQLFRNSISASSMSGLDQRLLQQLRAFTNITFTLIRSQLEPFEEPSMLPFKSATSSRAENGHITDDDDTLMAPKSRYYHYQGSCYQLEFDVKFVVREPDLVLEGLKIKVPTGVETELGIFLESKDETSSPTSSSLSKEHNHSPDIMGKDPLQSTVVQRKRKRSEMILPGRDGAQVLTFRGPKRLDMELVLNWRIHVDQHGQFTPLLRLLPKVTSLWKQADQKSVVENLPIQFLRLVEMKGVEGAIVTILKSVYGQEAMTPPASPQTEGEDGGDQDGDETDVTIDSSDEEGEGHTHI